MSVTLKFTYQPSKSLPEANKQITEFVELVKSQLLGVATKEELDGVQVEVEENIKESTKGFAGVRTKATDAESKVDMIANFDQATAQITLKAAMVNGIERSDITLSGDQILLNGNTMIGSGFLLTADNIAAGAITANKIASGALGGFQIDSRGLIYDTDNRYFRLSHDGLMWMIVSPPDAYSGEIQFTYLTGDSDTSAYYLKMTPNVRTGKMWADRGYFGKIRTEDFGTANGGDVVVTSNGWFKVKASGSSKRFKNSISYELTDDMNPEKLYDVSIVKFKYNKDYLSDEKDPRYDTPLIGMIAEDMDAHYPQACDYDEQGRPKGWNEHYIIPAMLKLIQDQHKEIEELKDTAAKRDSKIKELEARVAEISELVKGQN